MENSSPKYFLIVEDAPDLRFILRHFFTREGVKVETVENGQEALDFLRLARELPTFILLDLMMPILDGFAFREEQLKDPRLEKIPVVVMTASRDIELKSQMIGAAGYIKKPIANIDDLMALVKHFLGGA